MVRQLTLVALTAGDPTAARILIDYAKNATDEERPNLIQALGNTRDHQVIPTLRELLGGDDDDLVCVGLALAGDETIRPTLLKMIDSDNPERQSMAIYGLSKLGKQPDLDQLFKLLDGGSEEQAAMAVHGIGHTFNSDAQQPLIRWLDSQTNPQMLAAGIISLGCVGDQQAESYLAKHLTSDTPEIRRAAAIGMYILTGTQPEYADARSESTRLVVETYYQKARLKKVEYSELRDRSVR
jgi:HEAT repeat protein